jgi:hypothetical protein
VTGDAELVRAAGDLDRRGFLRLAAAAAAVGVVPAGCGGVPPGLVPAPDVTLTTLSPRAYATLTAAASRLVGPPGATLIERREVDVGRLADGLLGRNPALAAPIGQALAVLEFGVWPLVPKLRPFTALDAAGRDAALRDLSTSGLALKRAVFGGVRALALTAFYGAPQARPLTGYPGPFGAGGVGIADAMAAG